MGGCEIPPWNHTAFFRSDLYLTQICIHHILNLSDPSAMKLQVTLALICVLFPQGGYQQEISEKICSGAVESVSGTLNMGVDKLSINTRLCSTDLCNNQILPVLPFGPQNGRKCYTCTNNDCTKTLNCEGDEDRCFSAT
ncbi:hypothetical protein NFI96_032708, partial [Prochilodus magdalenae]